MPSSITKRAACCRRGFTLVELMIAVGIIVLMLALALPAFRAITGSRSTEGATNLVASMLSRARTDAIAGGQPYGVAFFYDSTGQYKLAEVAPVSFGNWGGLGVAYPLGAYVTYQPASGPLQYFVSVQAVPGGSSIDMANSTYANATAPPPTGTYWHQLAPATPEGYWAAASTTTSPVLYDQIPATDAVLLPTGVGAQVIVDSSLNTAVPDRYLRAGLVMFDPSGRLTNLPTVCSQYGLVGSAIGLDLKNAAAATGSTLAQTAQNELLPSSFGIVVYDRDAYGTQGFQPHDPTLDTSMPAYGTTATPTSEASAEQWLDLNAAPLLINRYTGDLVHGE
jgi:prepilin-type N-terminal cleavage/methylation domain-containing protein